MLLSEIDHFYQSIGEKLQARRLELGLQQIEVARHIARNRTSIANIESGRQKMPVHILADMLSFYGLNWGDVLPDLPPAVSLHPELKELAEKLRELDLAPQELLALRAALNKPPSNGSDGDD